MSNYAICPTYLVQNSTLIGGPVIIQNAAVTETSNWQEVALPFTGKDANGNTIGASLVCQPDANVWVAISNGAIAPADPVQGLKVLSGETVPLGILPGQRVFVRLI
jgi:hypothetical protein